MSLGFLLFDIMNNSIMNIYKHFLCGMFTFLLGIYLGSIISSYGNSVVNIFRNYKTVFPNNFTIMCFSVDVGCLQFLYILISIC